MSHFLNKKFDSLSLFFFGHKVQFLESYWKNQLCDSLFSNLSHIRERFNFWVVLEKKFILWIVFKKINFAKRSYSKSEKICESDSEKRFNSASHLSNGFNSFRHIEKRVPFFESSEKISIIWVIWKTRVQFFESLKKASSLRVFKKKSPNLWIKFQKQKFQVFASGTILWVIWKINSLRNFSKKKNSLNHLKTWITCKKCSIRWVVMKKKKVRFFDFESYISDKNSILWIIFKKFSESFWEKRSNSWSHIEKQERFNSLRQI